MSERDVAPAIPPTPGGTIDAPEAKQLTLTDKLQALRERYPKAEIAIPFAAGFAFDVLTLDRIDSVFSMVQQGTYLLLLGLLILYEQRHELGLARPPRWFAKVWRFSEEAIHFLLGSLLSLFSLFYFRSMSGLTAILFMVVMVAVLVANELPRFRKLGHVARLALWGFCVLTYFSYLIPTLARFLRWYLFAAAVAVSLAVGWAFFRRVERWAKGKLGEKDGRRWALRRVGAPYLAVHVVVVLLYVARAIPPIPVFAQDIGVYHSIQKEKLPEGDVYRLFHQNPWWRIWHTGDQQFRARPGDVVHVFFQVFGPTDFKGRVTARYEYRDPKHGWRDMGTTARDFTGGRAKGWRTFVTLANWKPGRWKISLESDDGRVIGSIGVTVVEDPSAEDRVFHEKVL